MYLGTFDNHPSPEQTRLLSQWDAVVLDPLQDGVLNALDFGTASTHVLARLNVKNLVEASSSTEDHALSAVRQVTESLNMLKRPGAQSPFTGVLLADSQPYLQPVILNELVKLLNRLGLDIWLELAPPEYLSESTCREIDMTRIRGMVYRNGTILDHGDRRNYYQMENMRRAMRVVAAQKPIGESTLAMWETVDDGVALEHHVLHRSFKWCNYNSAMCWIGPRAALDDAVVASARSVAREPIAALTWMKDEKTSTAHDIWRHNEVIAPLPCENDRLYGSLECFIPGLREKLALLPPRESSVQRANTIAELQGPMNEPVLVNPFSFSPDGHDESGLGCFQLGQSCTFQDIDDLIQAQRHTRDLNLLDPLKLTELKGIAEELSLLSSTNDGASELRDLLLSCEGSELDPIYIYSGLHSGFRARSGTEIWGIYELDPSGQISIFLSGRTEKERTGALLHTYLASRGYSRYECFMAEVALATLNGTLSEKWNLPTRIVKEIEQLTPAENISLFRRLSLCVDQESADLSARVLACCEYQLIELPTISQLRAISSSEYMAGRVSGSDIVTARLSWYHEKQCWAPDAAAAVSVFQDIDTRLPQILMAADANALNTLAATIQGALQHDRIDAAADIFALSVFCAFRRLALNEIHLEVLDRNPLPHANSVQTASFAEMYALGARCDSFFDMTPIKLGRILMGMSRKYYDANPPKRQEEAFTELPTAYASMDIDLDPKGEERSVPVHYRITFLGIFALPALIDITLLTTIGRGLYLTTFMSDTNKHLATTALMIALLVCGGFGGWISSGGSYYLYAMAFPAMGMFVMTRFIAGLAVILTAGIVSMIVIGCLNNFASGVLFFLYFFFLASYLMLLSVLSIYQLPGFDFQSVCFSLF